MAKAVHTMVRVLDEARSVDFYARAFGLAVADRIDFETFTLVYMRNAGGRLRGRADGEQGAEPSPTTSATATGISPWWSTTSTPSMRG